MATVILERLLPKGPNQLYILQYPVCTVNEDNQLTPLADTLNLGTVSAITIDKKDRYCVTFSTQKQLIFTKKKILSAQTNPDQLPMTDLLQASGYHFTSDFEAHLPLDHQFREHVAVCLADQQVLTTIPASYIAIDCEFAMFFEKHGYGSAINWRQTTILGNNASIFQLSALGFQAGQQTELFFDHYLDHPSFLPEKRLVGLAATGLTLSAYQQQADPVIVLKQFINQVLATGLPLAFWDQTNDLKCLRWLMAVHYDQLTVTERELLKQPLQLFDSEQYTNTVINRSNNKALNTIHLLPLNGVAGLLNIVNPHQHNALWDAMTLHHVIHKLATIQAQPAHVIAVPEPKPSSPTPMIVQSQQAAKYQLVHDLRAAGKTYREIAAVAGTSISGVNYILKKQAKLVN